MPEVEHQRPVETMTRRAWRARAGLVVVLAVFAAFVWGLHRRAALEAAGGEIIRVLFVPSVEQGTLVRRADELARFVRGDSGLTLRTEVPTSYAAVIQALGAGQADVAWMPAFAYVLANARYGAKARLQVVRSMDLFAIVVTRTGAGEPESLAALAARRVAFPRSVRGELRDRVRERLDRAAPGWIEIPVPDDTAAVRLLVERPLEVDAAVSSHVFSGPHDLIGDGRKLLEYERPGTLAETRVVDTTDTPVAQQTAVYYGCVFTRTDSGVNRLEDLNGRSFAFSDETSTSGHIFPRILLNRHHVTLGHVYYAGGHPNVVQAVWDGKVAAGSAFYSPPGEQQARDRTLVADARFIIMKRMPEYDERVRFLDEVRVLKLTDPIPNDLCCVRRGFPEKTWERFNRSLQRFLETTQGRESYFDLVAGVAAAPCDDAAFDGFREALRDAGVSASKLLEAEEDKLQRKRKKGSGS